MTTRTIIGIDGALTTERAAEHLLAQVASHLHEHHVDVEWLVTHRAVTSQGVHVAASVSVANELAEDAVRAVRARFGDVDLGEGADIARTNALDRREGRAVRFPGSGALTGDVVLGDLLGSSAIERVVMLGGGDAASDLVLRTRDFVRPRFDQGDLVLHVQPARGGVVVPFETPNPTPCCADHAP